MKEMSTGFAAAISAPTRQTQAKIFAVRSDFLSGGVAVDTETIESSQGSANSALNASIGNWAWGAPWAVTSLRALDEAQYVLLDRHKLYSVPLDGSRMFADDYSYGGLLDYHYGLISHEPTRTNGYFPESEQPYVVLTSGYLGSKLMEFNRVTLQFEPGFKAREVTIWDNDNSGYWWEIPDDGNYTATFAFPTVVSSLKVRIQMDRSAGTERIVWLRRVILGYTAIHPDSGKIALDIDGSSINEVSLLSEFSPTSTTVPTSELTIRYKGIPPDFLKDCLISYTHTAFDPVGMVGGSVTIGIFHVDSWETKDNSDETTIKASLGYGKLGSTPCYYSSVRYPVTGSEFREWMEKIVSSAWDGRFGYKSALSQSLIDDMEMAVPHYGQITALEAIRLALNFTGLCMRRMTDPDRIEFVDPAELFAASGQYEIPLSQTFEPPVISSAAPPYTQLRYFIHEYLPSPRNGVETIAVLQNRADMQLAIGESKTFLFANRLPYGGMGSVTISLKYPTLDRLTYSALSIYDWYTEVTINNTGNYVVSPSDWTITISGYDLGTKNDWEILYDLQASGDPNTLEVDLPMIVTDNNGRESNWINWMTSRKAATVRYLTNRTAEYRSWRQNPAIEIGDRIKVLRPSGSSPTTYNAIVTRQHTQYIGGVLKGSLLALTDSN